MQNIPFSDLVSEQYSHWPYPAPIFDLPAWLATNWQWFDPSHAHQIFWPDRDYKPDMDILIAGCGSNQAAIFAYTNPSANVLAIDVSAVALEHHGFLKKKYRLDNLELKLLPIEQSGDLKHKFDLIVSTGTLHHLLDPRRGVSALADCLKQDGVAALMVYAKYGRVGVQVMQSAFRDLALQQDDKSILVIKDAIDSLPEMHPARTYMGLALDLHSNAEWVDTYLPGREVSYSIDECIDLVTASGLVFQDLFLKSSYYPPLNSPNSFHSLVATQPRSKQWSIMERVNFSNACHFFMACRSDRLPSSYAIDFTSDSVFERVPTFRYRCGTDEDGVFRPGWKMALDHTSQALARKVDGLKSINEILLEASQEDLFVAHPHEVRKKYLRDVFQAFWQLDFLSMRLA